MRAYLAFAGRTPVLGATLVAALVLLVAVFPALPIGGETLDSRAGYTYEEAVAALEGYGEDGRRAYAWASATLDTLLPLVYATFLAGLLYRFRPAERVWRLAYLPLAAAALDLCENVQIVLMLAHYPDVSAAQVATASLFTLLKVAMIGCCLAVAVTVVAVWAVRHLRRGPAA